MLMWPWDRAAEVLKAWAAWTKTAPDEITTSARMLQIPPLPDLPAFLRGRAFVAIDGAYAGDHGTGAEVLAPLRALGPEMDTFGSMAPGGLSYVHMDPEGPTPGIGGHTVLDTIDDAAIDALVKIAGPGSGSPLVGVELRHLGGALARSDERHGAVDTMRGGYALLAVGVPMTPELGAAIYAHLPKVIATMGPWHVKAAYLNFAEETVDPARFYSPEGYGRLRRVKAEVDPAGLFRGNHAISGV